MSKNRNKGTVNDYKEVDVVNENEVKDVDVNETVDNQDQEKPEGESKPETKSDEKKEKEGFITRLSKKKWVRVTGYVLAGVASATAGALIYKHFGGSDVSDVIQTVQDKIPEGVNLTIETAADNVARITDNNTGVTSEVTVDKVVNF